MAFTDPQAFWYLLALPLLFIIAAVARIRADRARHRFARHEMYRLLSRSLSMSKRYTISVLTLIGIGLTAIALTGPRFGTKTEIVTRAGVDVVIALDTSYSMLAEDVSPNRMLQARYEMGRLIDNLQGDRVALIAFSGGAIVQCPLTTDYNAAKTFLNYIDVGVVPSAGSNLDTAIAKALRLFEQGQSGSAQSRIIVLATDGESLRGDPIQAARNAAAEDIRIFTVGIGTTSGEILPIRDEQGQVLNYKRDSSGNVVTSSLDEATLEAIAEETGGMYLRTEGGETDIQALIDELGTMSSSDIHERKISRLRERYQIPLGAALLCLAAALLIGERTSVRRLRWSRRERVA